MKAATIVLVLAVIGHSGAAWAVTGCLTDEKELVRRASVIIVGKLESLETLELPPCPPPPLLEPGRAYVSQYNKCGTVNQATVRTKLTLRGSTQPATVQVLMAAEGFLVLSCDDRPPLDKLAGNDVVLFLENAGGRLWTLDGPNSVETWLTEASIARLKTLIESASKE